MPLCEQRYRQWCERMAATAVAEQTCLELPMTYTDIPGGEASETESFHSANSTQRRRKSTRRRTTSGPESPKSSSISSQTRISTWPRSTRSSVSHNRPALPSRRSSHFSTTSSRQRSDLATFHRESCQLFSSIDAAVTDSGYSSIHRPGSSRIASTTSIPQGSQPTSPSVRCSGADLRPALSTIVLWKSEETRRIEYEKIDRAHSGLRGLSKKILPRFCRSKRCWRKFFDGKCDGDSVRRYRMSFSDEE